jgi:hypothetical protein
MNAPVDGSLTKLEVGCAFIECYILQFVDDVGVLNNCMRIIYFNLKINSTNRMMVWLWEAYSV